MEKKPNNLKILFSRNNLFGFTAAVLLLPFALIPPVPFQLKLETSLLYIVFAYLITFPRARATFYAGFKSLVIMMTFVFSCLGVVAVMYALGDKRALIPQAEMSQTVQKVLVYSAMTAIMPYIAWTMFIKPVIKLPR